MKTLLRSCFIVLAALIAQVSHAAATNDRVTLSVTDRGINQKAAWIERGIAGVLWVFGSLPESERIAVVMPDIRDMQSTSTEELTERIFRDLQARVDRSLAAGGREFEIQLIQDINLAGYASSVLGDTQGRAFLDNRQENVDRFGAAAYGAIVRLNGYLEQRGMSVQNRGVFGSNGVKVFAASLQHWLVEGQSIWDSVDLFDGRAFFTPIVAAIKAIGAERVRVFNTHGDYWGMYTPFGVRSLANVNTAAQIKDTVGEASALRVYLLRSVWDVDKHISGMVPTNQFRVWEYLGKDIGFRELTDTYTGSQLRDPLPAAPAARVLPPDIKEGIVAYRDILEDLLLALEKFGGAYGDQHGGDADLGEGIAVVTAMSDLALSIRKDLEDHPDRSLLHLSSNTTDALFRAMLKLVEHTYNVATENKGPLKDVFGAIEGIVLAAKTQIGSSNKASPEVTGRWVAGQIALIELQLKNVLDRIIATESAAVQTKIRAAFARVFLVLDALAPLAEGVAMQEEAGGLTLQVVDKYSDALITFGASLLTIPVMILKPDLAPYGGSIRDGLAAGAKTLRANDTIKSFIRSIYMAFDDSARQQVVDQYLVYLTRQLSVGEPVRPITDFMPREELRGIGISDSQIDHFLTFATKQPSEPESEEARAERERVSKGLHPKQPDIGPPDDARCKPYCPPVQPQQLLCPREVCDPKGDLLWLAGGDDDDRRDAGAGGGNGCDGEECGDPSQKDESEPPPLGVGGVSMEKRGRTQPADLSSVRKSVLKRGVPPPKE